ncbi:MAG: hypothetical protein HOJ14_09945 [Nitrospina sp.]|nr:hypothetical protein [Nitrospina sp.]
MIVLFLVGDAYGMTAGERVEKYKNASATYKGALQANITGVKDGGAMDGFSIRQKEQSLLCS